MTANFWEYESSPKYFGKQRATFEREAKVAVGNSFLRNELRFRGQDPGLFDFNPTIFDDKDSTSQVSASRDRGGGGILGKIGSALTTPFELAGEGAVIAFNDTIGPAIKAFEWEAEHIGEPLYEKVTRGIATPLRVLGRGESFTEAYAATGEKELPDILKLGGGMIFSPSTWIGPGLLGKGFKGVKVAGKTVTNSRFLSPIFGSNYPRIMGAAPEGATMEKILAKSNELPDAFRARSSQEVLLNSASQFRISRVAKSMLLKTGTSRWINERWPGFFESDVGVLYGHRTRMAGIFDSMATAYMETVGPEFVRAFKTNTKGRITNVTLKAGAKGAEKTPAPADFISNSSKYQLSGLQQKFIKSHDEVFGLVSEGESAFGVGTNIRQFASGSYAHRQSLNRFIKLRDPSSLEEYEQLVDVGSSIRQGFGSKQSFEKAVRVSTQAQGESAGLKYLPFIEAQGVRIRQSGIRMADEWFKAAVAPIAKTPKELMPTELSETLARLATEQSSLKRVENAIKSAGINGRFARPRNLTGEAEGYATMISGRLNKTTNAAGAQAYLKQAAGDISKEIKAVQAATRGPTTQWKQLMKRIKQGGTPEFPTSIPNLGGRFAEANEGRKLNQLLKPKYHGPIESNIIKINDAVRPVMANLDISYLGIQGLIGLARNPVGYAKAVRYTMSQPELYDEYMKGAKSTGHLDEFIAMEGKLMSRNDMGEFLFKGPLANAPGFKLSNVWFTKFGNIMRMELYKGARNAAIKNGIQKGISREQSLKSLAESVGKATGYVAGEISTVEQVALFAPRFFRSQLSFISDALTRGDIAGAEARRSLTSLIVGGSALVAASNHALGNPTEFDFNSSNFVRVRALGRDISVFGPWDTLVKGLSRLYKQGPLEAATYMARAKASPAVSQAWAILSGETFHGERLDFDSVESILTSVALVSRSALPISVQQAAGDGLPTNIRDVAGTALEFAGTKSTPLTVFERLDIDRQRLSLDSFGVEWEDLEPHQRRKLEAAYPKLTERQEAFSDVGKAFEVRSNILDLYKDQQAALDAQIPAGPEWIEAYRKLNERKAGALAEWERQSPDAAGNQARDLESSDPNKRARAEFYAAFDKAKNSFGGINVEELSQVLRAAESTWTASQKAYVDRNTGLSSSARVTEWRSAQDTLKDYWRITDQVWGLLREQPEYATYNSLDAYIVSVSKRLRQMGLPEETVELRISKLPIISHMERAVNDLRKKLRLASPKVDQALMKWYGYTAVDRTKKVPETVLSTLTPGKLGGGLRVGTLSGGR